MTSNLASRSVVAFASVLGLTLAAAPASAQIDGGAIDGGGADVATSPMPLSATDFTLSILRFDPTTTSWVRLTATEQAYFFGRARCECAADATSWTGSFKIAIESSPTAGDKVRALLAASGAGVGRAALYAGSIVDCLMPGDDQVAPSQACLNLVNPWNYGALVPGGLPAIVAARSWTSAPIPVAWLFNAARSPVCNSPESCSQTSTCATTRSPLNLYFWAQTSALGVPDLSDLSLSLTLSGSGAMAPSNVTVEAGARSLDVEWSWPIDLNPIGTGSFLGVQLFCQRGGGDQVFSTGTFTPAFSSAATLCPAVAPAAASPLPLDNLAPRYLCSDLLPASTTRYRIAGLENGVPYGVSVAVIDRWGNVSASDPVFQLTKATDADAGAAEGDAPAEAQGGGCSMARGGGGARASLALLALGALLVGRVRLRRRG